MAQAHVIPEAIATAVPQKAGTIGIVGSGLAARGIARLAARRGFDVELVDPRRLNGAEAASLLSRLGGCNVVIEATEDDLETKLAILRELDAGLGPDAIIATQTATLSVTKLAAATQHPERVVGLHFVQPVAEADLVEVVRALQTSDAAHDEACRFVRALGKILVATKDQPGFLVHRLLIPFINEACFALQEGLGSAEDIDRAARLGGSTQGPLRMADAMGLDQCLFIAERLQREFGDDKYRPAALLKTYVAAGWLGRKTGRGFYVYPHGV